MCHPLLDSLERLHLSPAVAARIRRTLGLDVPDVLAWCRAQIARPDRLTRVAGRWHVRGEGFLIVVDAEDLRIRTARREPAKLGADMRGVGVLRRLDDLPEARDRLFAAFGEKTHREVSEYALLLAEHVAASGGLAVSLAPCADVIRRWQRGEAHFQEARDVSGLFHDLARAEQSPVKHFSLRAIAQAAATPHVKRHALIASEYAVRVVNLLHPGDWEAVRTERAWQISCMERVAL